MGQSGSKGPAGGGLIRIEASGEARILGILTANGAPSPSPADFDSSGGGIYLRCYALSGASTAQLLAKGGSGGYWASGGGRIAVWRAQDGAGGPFGPNFGFGTNSALKGTCTSVNGANGTVVYGMLPLRGAIFKFR